MNPSHASNFNWIGLDFQIVVCQGAKCMYSCGTTTENRKNDLKSIIDGTSQEGSDGVYCSKNNQVKSGRQSG